MGALSGSLVAGSNGEVTSGLMFTVFIYASAAATLGGLDSPGGAVIAGLSIGVVENMAAGYFPVWIGQEMKLSRRPAHDLRRAAGQAVGPVRLDSDRTGLRGSMP